MPENEKMNPSLPTEVNDGLLELRKSINSIDDEILRLVNERAKIALKVGELKSHNDTDFYIPTREKAILKRLTDLNGDKGKISSEAVRSIFREIISVCRSLETRLTVAFLGPEASYHHCAGQAQFGRMAQYVPAKTISGIFDEVERNRVDFGIAAIENSIEGSVGETLDRLANTNIRIVGEVYLPITHNLISFSELHDIKKVYSHPQAFAQCRRWLESNLPDAVLIDAPSTTHGVHLCKEERSAAAIASSLSAELMEVPIQVHGIQDIAGNTTRFFIIGNNKTEPSGDDKTTIMLFLRDKVGALYTMLEPFKRYKINLTNIVSRPTKQEAWQYMFFIEFQGHRDEEMVKELLSELDDTSHYIKILGSYPRGTMQSKAVLPNAE